MEKIIRGIELSIEKCRLVDRHNQDIKNGLNLFRMKVKMHGFNDYGGNTFMNFDEANCDLLEYLINYRCSHEKDKLPWHSIRFYTINPGRFILDFAFFGYVGSIQLERNEEFEDEFEEVVGFPDVGDNKNINYEIVKEYPYHAYLGDSFIKYLEEEREWNTK